MAGAHPAPTTNPSPGIEHLTSRFEASTLGPTDLLVALVAVPVGRPARAVMTCFTSRRCAVAEPVRYRARRASNTDVISVSPPTKDTSTRITVRTPTRDDARKMWHLANGAVDANSPYSYLMMVEYLGGTCAVAVDDDGDVAGFVTGFRLPDDPSTLFIWQIAVDSDRRGLGIGAQLLDGVADRPAVPRLRYLEASVTPGNEASASLFRAFGESRRTECNEEELFEASDFPGNHDAEVRFRIGPF